MKFQSDVTVMYTSVSTVYNTCYIYQKIYAYLLYILHITIYIIDLFQVGCNVYLLSVTVSFDVVTQISFPSDSSKAGVLFS